MIGTWIGAVLAGAIGSLSWLGWRHGGMLAILVVLALHALGQAHHVDDAGIVYAYAENIAGGYGLVAQPGGPVVEGISDPLWLIALLPAALVGADVGAWSSILQAALMLGVVFFAGRIAVMVERLPHERALPRDPGTTALSLHRPEPPPEEERPKVRIRFAGLVRLAVATSGVVYAWTSAGLEGALFAFLLMLTMWAAASRLGVLVALGVFLCAWTRPEGAIAGIGVAAGGIALHGQWRTLLWPIGAGLLGLGSVHGLRWAWLGTLFPNSASAKMGLPSWHLFLSGARYAALASALSGWPLLALGWLATSGRRRWLYAACLVLATGLGLAVLSGGDWMRHGRFLAPYLPIVLALGLPPVAQAWKTRPLARVALVATLVVGWGVLVDASLRPTVPVDHGLRRGKLYGAIASDACGADDLSVATPDIGGVLWQHRDVEVMDLAGLIDPEAARHRLDEGYWAGRIEARPPALIDLHDRWARITGLDAEALDDLGYRVLARRAGMPEDDPRTPTLWLHDRCDRALGESSSRLLATWVEKGSGQAW